MKIMLFCYAEEAKIELLSWTKYLAELPHQFIVTPIIRLAEKVGYASVISQLSQSAVNISVDPVYLKSSDEGFRNLLNPKVLLNDFLAIFRVLTRSRPDVIVCFYIPHAYPLVVLKRIFNFSLCVVAMGSDVNLENSLFQRMTRKFIYRNCELIFARSRPLKEKIVKECDCKVIVSPSSTDTSFFRPHESKPWLRQKWNVNPENYVLLTVCRLDKNKGVDVLIRSLRVLNSNDVDLFIVGEGAERETLEELSSTLGIQKNVKFLGFRQREELLELYNLANVFTLASYAEGLPRVLIEAMACECIPIVTDVGDVAAVVSDGVNGFIISPGDYVKFAEKIKEILYLPEERLRLMQRRTRSIVEDGFDTKEVIKRMVSNIDALYLPHNVDSASR